MSVHEKLSKINFTSIW